MQTPGYYLIIAGIIAIIVELLLGVATGFDLFIIGVLFIIGGVITIFSNMTIGIGLVAALILMYALFGRKIIKQTLSKETKKTNIDGIIGKTALTVKHITPTHPGQVKIDGEVWRAQSNEQIENGSNVNIISVTGVTLKVQKI